MVCPKLKNGNCKATKKVCKSKYKVKMINHSSCSAFKKGAKKKRR